MLVEHDMLTIDITDVALFCHRIQRCHMHVWNNQHGMPLSWTVCVHYVLLQCYSLAVIGYRVATFNDCATAAEELKHVCNAHFYIELLMRLQTYKLFRLCCAITVDEASVICATSLCLSLRQVSDGMEMVQITLLSIFSLTEIC